MKGVTAYTLTVSVILVALLSWIIVAFIVGSPNPMGWDQGYRGIMVTLPGIFALIGILM